MRKPNTDIKGAVLKNKFIIYKILQYETTIVKCTKIQG